MRPHLRLSTCFAMIMLIGPIAACGKFPELDAQISQEAAREPYPDLVPVESLHMNIPEPRITPETGSDLEARIDALQRRADAIRGPVIDPATKQRMEAGVAR